jgi:hypothetical protein
VRTQEHNMFCFHNKRTRWKGNKWMEWEATHVVIQPDQINSVAISRQANYTDRPAATCRWNQFQLLWVEGCHVISGTGPHGRSYQFSRPTIRKASRAGRPISRDLMHNRARRACKDRTHPAASFCKREQQPSLGNGAVPVHAVWVAWITKLKIRDSKI